jgi:pSer/pThr/pTyr-binding forkhead associated (FHA) protein
VTAARALGTTLKYKITVFSGKNPGKSFVFDKPMVTIGRDPENDLVFANDPRMSRCHVEIRFQAGKLIVKNVSQKNHVLVNNERVEEKILDGPAFVQVGETSLQLSIEESVSSGLTKSASAAVSVPKPPAPAPPPPKAAATVTQAKTAALTVVPTKTQQSLVKAQTTSSVPVPPPKAPPPPPVPSYQTPPAAPSYQSPPQAMPSSQTRPSPPMKSSDNGRIRFYAIIVAVGLFFAWILNDTVKNKKKEVNIRTEGEVSRAIEESARAVQELQKKQSSSGQDTIQYRAAEEHYIRGFRDYRQGQYARAMQSFSAALSFYPGHELARKYYLQSQRKFDAQIDFAMSQGRKYYQKNNFKMCQSSFANAMIMVKNSSSQKYKESKQLYDECRLRQEDRH